MNKTLTFLLLLLLSTSLQLQAQSSAKYGTVSRRALLESMPESAVVRQQLDSLRSKFEAETQYNETNFRRQFSEFLQVQKNLPEAILRKRQGDLQIAMERALDFRRNAELLLRTAHTELHAPLHARIDAALRAVGTERGYEMIIDLDSDAHPYLSPALTEDAMPWVKGKLTAQPAPRP